MAILSSAIKIKQINFAMHWLMVAQYFNLALLQSNSRVIELKQLFFIVAPCMLLRFAISNKRKKLKQLSERETPEEVQD
jgi:hypothetical protein